MSAMFGHVGPVSGLQYDFGLNAPASGVITDAVAFKASASAPEQPFAKGRVWLLRLRDGKKAWEGLSDDAGAYTADRLEAGHEYIAVGIDPWRTHKAVAAGPVTAVAALDVHAHALQAVVGEPLHMWLHIVNAQGAAIARIKSGAMPDGMTYNGRYGFSGEWPTGAPGTYPLVLELQDARGKVERQFVVTLRLLPLALSSDVPAPAFGQPYSQTLVATGGERPYVYSISEGALPTGLSLNPDTGELSGTTTATSAHSFTITVTDARATQANVDADWNIRATPPAMYWRIYITETNSAGYGAVGELEFLDYNGIRVPLSDGAPIASSALPGHEAAFAFDGLINNASGGNVWAPTTASPPSWLGYRHSKSVAVAAVRVTARSSAFVEQSPKAFIVQSSNGGNTWVDRLVVTNQTGWSGNEQRTFILP